MINRSLLFLLVLFTAFNHGCVKDDNIPEDTKDLPDDKVITAINIYDDNVWVGTFGNGLYKFDGKSWTGYTRSDGLVSDSIQALAVSNNGSVWVGTINGISKFTDQNFINITESEGLFNNDIRSLACDRQNNLWIGTRNNRVVKYDGAFFTTYHINPDASGPGEVGHIHTITHDLEENVWVGSCVSGLSKFDGTLWTDYVNGLNVFVTSSICKANGDVWIGHINGVYEFSEDVWTGYKETDGLVGNIIKCFALDDQDNIWIGTDSGLSMYDGTSWINYSTDEGLLSNNISALAYDPNGDIWVGSSSGLFRFSPYND